MLRSQDWYPPSGAEVVVAVLVVTLETTPVRARTGRRLRWRPGTSRQAVREIWRAFGLKPWLAEEFKLSPDVDLVEEVRDIVGPYLSPPVVAAVNVVDENPRFRGWTDLRRSYPPHPSERPMTINPTATLDLFAALNFASGTVISDLRKTHTAIDFIASSSSRPGTDQCRRSGRSRHSRHFETTSPPQRPRRRWKRSWRCRGDRSFTGSWMNLFDAGPPR